MHLFLGEQRRRGDNEVSEILLVLAAPDQLQVQISVASLVGYPDGMALERRPGLVPSRR